MIVIDINTKNIIEELPYLIGHVYWSTPAGWAQYKLDMIAFSKAMKVIEDKLFYGDKGST